MRLIHTSDWHLGRRLNEYSLIQEQAHALEQIAQMCREEKADALLIAGDLFDRAIPPEEAVTLFSEFLHRLATEAKIPVVAISGNHDSAERLSFGAEFLARGGVHLRTRLGTRDQAVVLENDHSKVHLYGLPYVEPIMVRAALGDDSIRTHDHATRAALREVVQQVKTDGVPSVLLAHLFARGGSESPDSERSLEIGGAAQVELSALEGFSYVALGHLHAPQRVGGREDIRYSGSLLKYSVGEAQHRKGVSLIELGSGPLVVRELPLTPRRDVLRIEGTVRELLDSSSFEHARSAFVEVTYTDTDYQLDVAPRLRERFPYLLSALPRLLTLKEERAMAVADPDTALRDTRALLEGFWGYVLGEGDSLDEAHHTVFRELVGELESGAGADKSSEVAA